MYISFGLYLLIVLLVAIGSKKNKKESTSEFYTGSRSFGSLITAISAGATDISGWIFIGAVGTAYMVGTSMVWILVGSILGLFVNWFIVGPRLNKFAIETNSLSLVDVFEKRVNDKTKLIRLVSGVIIVIFFIPYMSSQMMSVGTVVESIFKFDYTYGMILGSAFVLCYVLIGGYRSVMLTDFVQGLIMLSVLIFFPIYGIMNLGGFGVFFQTIMNIDPLLWSTANGAPLEAAFALIFGYIIFGMGIIGQPHITQRFISARNPKTILEGTTIIITWQIITVIGATLIGLLARVYLPTIENPEYSFPEMANTLLHPVIIGIVIAAIFSAIQSTLSSQLIVTTQSVVTDILGSLTKKVYSEKQTLLISRVVMVLLLLVAFFIATLNLESVFNLVLYAWGGIAASFGPLVVLMLYTNKVRKWGAFFGIITGTLATIIWVNLGLSSVLYELIPAGGLAALVILIVSKFERTNELKKVTE